MLITGKEMIIIPKKIQKIWKNFQKYG